MIKKIGVFIGVVLLLVLLVYAALVAANNTGGGKVQQEQVEASLERSIEWLVEHRDRILESNNPTLWWWVMRSANITRDPRLMQLYFEYHRRHLKDSIANPWVQMFEDRRMEDLGPEMIAQLPDYNQYMLFGLSCSAHLFGTDVIQRQTRTNFCREYHPVSPACVTHQMMGLNFRIQRQCGNSAELKAQMKQLQEKVVWQLRLDPRVVDVYLQRVMMLLDTGAGTAVNPRWVQRVLDAQLDDGGWARIDPLFPVGGGKVLGLSSKSIGLSTLSGNFHTTAQGLLIMSLLLEPPQLAQGGG